MATVGSPSPEEQEGFWDWHWEHWRERKTINEWKDRRHEVVVAYLDGLALERRKIIDLGCGPGWYTEKLARFGQVTGVDLSAHAIAMARRRFPDIRFEAGNFYDLQLPLGHFDIVVAQEVIDHVEDRGAFLVRARELLRPHGYLIFSCANKFVMDRVRDGQFPVQPSSHITNYVPIRGWKRLLRADFNVHRMQTILPIGSRGILRLVNSYKLNALLGLLVPQRHLESLKERIGLGYTLIVLAQKRA